MQTHSLLGRLISTLALATAPACVISATDSGDDADGMTMGSSSGSDDASASGNGSNGDPSSDSDGEDDESSSGADESSGGDPTDEPTDDPTAGGEGPEDGLWIYSDNGASSNDCTFLEATQGVGDFTLENHGDGTFTIVPGDETDPFECELGEGGRFDCPERYVETITEPGVDAALDAFVAAEGTTAATEMEGEQLGRLVCEGEDCALAEQVLGTSFPCSFVIPFTAMR